MRSTKADAPDHCSSRGGISPKKVKTSIFRPCRRKFIPGFGIFIPVVAQRNNWAHPSRPFTFLHSGKPFHAVARSPNLESAPHVFFSRNPLLKTFQISTALPASFDLYGSRPGSANPPGLGFLYSLERLDGPTRSETRYSAFRHPLGRPAPIQTSSAWEHGAGPRDFIDDGETARLLGDDIVRIRASRRFFPIFNLRGPRFDLQHIPKRLSHRLRHDARGSRRRHRVFRLLRGRGSDFALPRLAL